MIHTKRVIFMIAPLLFVPLVYGMSSTPDACAVPKDPNFGKIGSCALNEPEDNPSGRTEMVCCWEEPDILNPGETIQWCQTCDMQGDCTPPFGGRSSSTGPPVLPDEGVLDEGPTPTPSPTSPFRPPTSEIFDPPSPASPLPTLTPFPPPPSPTPSPTSPFGPTGGIFDPPTVSPPTPKPTPFPTSPQDDGSGPLNPQGGGILQQPEEVEDPEDGGENEEEEGSSEGAETAGPLT